MESPVRPIEIEALKELANRKCDTLDIFRPMNRQEGFFLSRGTECVLRGGNRSGKSTCVAAKFAAIARDKPITLADGRKINMRRKYQKGKCLRMWIIAYDSKYIGQTIHRLLFQAGLFRIIRNKDTGEWVPFNQNNEDHAERIEEATDAPPLIPESWVAPGSWDWENLGNREFNRVDIVNPQTGEKLAEVFAYSSKGDPKAGDPVDHIWIDEKIRYPRHYAEWQARILDRKGRIDWSSWPAMGNYALTELTKRAKKCRAEGTHRVDEIVLRTDDNEFFDKEEFKQWSSSFSGGEYLARVCGEYQTDGLKMYPLFSRDICSAIVKGGNEDELSKAIRGNNMEPPSTWTRELVLDPGTANPAVLFCAIPPPMYGNYFVVYDEICIPRLDAKQLAAQIKVKMGGASFYRFIIDGHAGRTTPMGFGVTVEENYSKEFEEAGILCEATGSQFTYGSDNVAGRIQVLQEWMHIQAETGLPKLRIVTHRCPTLCEQLSEYEKEMVSDIVSDFKPAKRQTIDAAVSLEYWASRMPKYVPPRLESKEAASMQTLWDKMKKLYFSKGAQDADSDAVLMGPPG